MGKYRIPIEKYGKLMNNEKNVQFPLNNMGNLQKDEEMTRVGGVDKRTHAQTKVPCVLQDIVPFGAAALLPLTPIHNHSKQGNGYR